MHARMPERLRDPLAWTQGLQVAKTALAVVVGRHPEHRRIGRRPRCVLLGELPAPGGQRDELRHSGVGTSLVVDVLDRPLGGESGVGVRQ